MVITVIIIIILAVVTINFIFNGGILDRTEQGAEMHNIEATREDLSIVLADAFTEKQINSEYNQDEFLDDFIYERRPEAEVDDEEISLNGYTFELDRSVPQLGDYVGESGNLPARIRKVEVTNKTLSEVSIQVTTARAEGATLRYSYKKITDADYQGNIEQSENTYTFSELESKQTYKIKVELLKDNQVVDTEEIEVRLGNLEEGSITFGEVTWSAGTASVPVSTNTSYQLQYQIEATEESGWKNVPSNGIITGITNGQEVYARLFDGSNGSDYASIIVKDTTPPEIIRFEATEINANSIKVEVEAKDEESGLAATETYQYYLGDELKETSTNTSYTFEGLASGTVYEVKVVVKNGVNKTNEKEIPVETKEPIPIEEVLTTDEATYVNFKDATGVTRLCAVLYDASSEYGVEIITMDTVEDIELGNGTGNQQQNNTTYFNIMINSYNNAIITLNARASAYNNSEYSEMARCVGSVPNNPTSESTTYRTSIDSYMSNFNGKFKDKDTNYLADYNQMGTLGITSIAKGYWLASRAGDWNSSYSDVIVWSMNNQGYPDGIRLGYIYNNGNTLSTSTKLGLRPVFHLKEGVKVVGGSGTQDDPYELGM